MSDVREELVSRLAAELTARLPADGTHAVVTDARFMLLPEITAKRTRFDLTILGVASQRQVEPVSLQAGVPIFGLNVVTPDTLVEDLVETPNLMSRSTVGNYVLFDPTCDVLRPCFQAYTVKDGGLEVVRTASTGEYCHCLGFQLALVGDRLTVSAAPLSRDRSLAGGDSE